MTPIRLTRSGLNVAGAVRFRGDVVDVDDEVADYLCSSGQAARVSDDRAGAAPEAAVRRATTRPPRTRVETR